ncbi:uncharacterized protein LOC144511928 isoform X2 [Mustelus asterias]
MEAFSILCAVYCLTVYHCSARLTSDVKSSRCENGELCDQDHHGTTGAPNCTAVEITVEEFHVEELHDWVNIGVRNHLDNRTVRESLTGILRRGHTYRIPFSFGFQVYVHFHSDKSIQFKGFRFSYNIVPKDQRHVRIVELTFSSVLLMWNPSVSKTLDTSNYKVYYGLYINQPILTGFHLVSGSCDYNLTGLDDSTSYFAYVIRLLDCGHEDTGHLVNFTTRSKFHGDSLPTPVGLKAMEVEAGTVFVSWTLPAAAASRLIKYRVYIVADTETQVKVTSVRFITLRNLETDQDYTITVTSVNGQEEGLPGNPIIIRLQRHQTGEAALWITPALAGTVTGSIRSKSLLLQLPACGLFDQITQNLRWEPSQNFTVYVLVAESTAILNLSSDPVPIGQNASYGYTDGGRWGPYIADRHLPVNECYHPPPRKNPIRDFGIFQIGSEETCPPVQMCNGPLRSNTTYRGRYVLMNDGSLILSSQWSEPFTTRAADPHQDLTDTDWQHPPGTITITVITIILCLLLPLCLMAACFWRYKRTDQKWFVWRSLNLSEQNPVQLSAVNAMQDGITDINTLG